MKVYEVSLKFDCVTDYAPLMCQVKEYDELEVQGLIKSHADKHNIPYDFLQDKGIIIVEGMDTETGMFDEPILLEPDFSTLLRIEKSNE